MPLISLYLIGGACTWHGVLFCPGTWCPGLDAYFHSTLISSVLSSATLPWPSTMNCHCLPCLHPPHHVSYGFMFFRAIILTGFFVYYLFSIQEMYLSCPDLRIACDSEKCSIGIFWWLLKKGEFLMYSPSCFIFGNTCCIWIYKIFSFFFSKGSG